MKPNAVDILLEIIDRGYDQTSWHGPNLRSSLRGVNEQQAGWRPAADRHSIWEHTLHAAYWKYTVRRRILGEKRGSFPLTGSNWFPTDSGSKSEWKNTIRLLDDTHQSMRQAIAGLKPRQIAQQMPNAKVSHFHVISGVAAHDVYHAGQIQLLRRLQA